jgi:phosphoribosylglycinamide formyltransferase-1
MKRLALFASGNGTNVQQITEYFAERNRGITADCVIYNRKDAYVATRAKNLNLPAFYMKKDDFYSGDKVLNLMSERGIDYIILAGFLLLVPQNLIEAYPERIINIHPALLPKYGGPGMYGHHVHETVIAHHEPESGITIHLVDQQFDHGRTLFQAKCQLTSADTPDTLASKIHLLEKEYYPRVIEQFVNGEF